MKRCKEFYDTLKKLYPNYKYSKDDIENILNTRWRLIVAIARGIGLRRGIDIQYVLQQAQCGRSASAVAKEIGISRNIILALYKKHGFKNRIMNYNLPAEEIIRRYKHDKISPDKLATEYGCSTMPIYRILKANDICPNTDRDYLDTLEDENYFEHIDSEVKAYLLGFIAADGSISKTKRRGDSLYLTIGISDEKHLKRLAREIGWRGKISYCPPCEKKFNGDRFYKCKAAWRFTIGSKKLVTDIISHGVGLDKSKQLLLPKLEKEFYAHFIRGFFDGDGCITFSHDSKFWEKGRPHFSIIGLRSILEGMQNILIQNCGVSCTKLIAEKRVKACRLFNLHYGGEYAILIRNYMYHNATIYLERKYKRFFSVESPASRRGGYTISEYCEKYEFNKKTVSQWIDKDILPLCLEYGLITINKKIGDTHANFMANTVTVQEAANIIGIPLWLIYQLTHLKIINVCKIARMRNRIAKKEVERIKITGGAKFCYNQYNRIERNRNNLVSGYSIT